MRERIESGEKLEPESPVITPKRIEKPFMRTSNVSAVLRRPMRAAALRVLRALMVGRTREAFCVREGLALERLLEGVTVVELDGLGDMDASSLLVSVLIQKLRNHHTTNHDGLRGLIVIEEAQHLLAEGDEATSVIAAACREIRSYGIGLLHVTQTPSEFSRHALANVNTIVAHKLVQPTDRSAVGRMMNLETDLLGTMPVGEALVDSRGIKWVRFPRVERRQVRDDELPAVHVEREEVAADFAQRGEVRARVARLSQTEERVLDSVAEARAVHPRGIRELLRVRQETVSDALHRLLNLGLVAYAQAGHEGPGRPRSIYFLTPYGAEAYRQRTGHYHDRSAGDLPHPEAVAQVVHQLRIQRRPHPRFDILFEEGGRERAIEVETGANNDAQLMENLRKSLEFQNEAVFAVTSERVGNRVLQAAARMAMQTRQTVELRLFLSGGWRTYGVGFHT